MKTAKTSKIVKKLKSFSCGILKGFAVSAKSMAENQDGLLALEKLNRAQGFQLRLERGGGPANDENQASGK